MSFGPMRYFPRGEMSGKNIKRLDYATIRGTVRRNDPDGVVPNPYFPSLTVGQTLKLAFDGGGVPVSVVVTFTSNVYSIVLSDIQTAIGANGVVSDADGCIQIQTATPGGAGFLGVLPGGGGGPGTGAAAIGFMVSELQFSIGGDIPRAPEGRVGNNAGVAFPGTRENFSSLTLQRPLAVLAGNSDVLFSDISRRDLISKKTYATVNGQSGAYSYISMNGASPVYTGMGGVLYAAADKTVFAPFFTIIDTTTNQPSASQVVGMVNGVPSGSFPFTGGTPTWAGNEGFNILGTSLDKVTAAAISTISDNLVTCPSANFNTAGVQVGDYVEIAQDANPLNDPFQHYGYIWVVSEIWSQTQIRLRPMSVSELSLVGGSAPIMDPLSELNEAVVPGKTYGLLTVRTGLVNSRATLIVSPALPTGTSVEVWYSTAQGLRDAAPADRQLAKSPGVRDIVSPYDPEPNGLMSQPNSLNIFGGGASIIVGSFYVRRHGKIILVPATTVYPVVSASPLYLYWEDTSNSVKVYDSATPSSIFSGPNYQGPNFSATTPRGFPLAKATAAGGIWTSVESVVKQENGNSSTLSVGFGGQFLDLYAAADYLNSIAPRSFSAARPAYELVLVGDVTVSPGALGTPSFPAGTLIRGASKDVQLTCVGQTSNDVFLLAQGSLVLENLTVVHTVSAEWGSLIGCEADSSATITIRNVGMLYGLTDVFRSVVRGSNFANVTIADCFFRCTASVLSNGTSGVNLTNVSLRNSTFQYSYSLASGSTTPLILQATTIAKLDVYGCSFLNWTPTATNPNLPLFFDYHAVSSPTSTTTVTNCDFSLGSQSDLSWLFDGGLSLVTFTNCRIYMTGNAGISKVSIGCAASFHDCNITTNAFHASLPAIGTTMFNGNVVTIQTDTVSHQNGTLVKAYIQANDNAFYGAQTYVFIDATQTGVIVSNNQFSGLTTSPYSGTTLAFIYGGTYVHGNWISAPALTAQYGIHILSGAPRIEGNLVSLNTVSGWGIYIDASCLSSYITGNQVSAFNAIGGASTTTVSATDGNLIYATGSFSYGMSGTFSNNNVTGDLRFNSGEAVVVSDCQFYTVHTSTSTGTIFTGCTFVDSSSLTNCFVTGCSFTGNQTLLETEVDSSTFNAAIPATDFITCRNVKMRGCTSATRIRDHLTDVSQYNYFFNTYCYSPNVTYYFGLFVSSRTRHLIVSGCDMAAISGNYADNSTPAETELLNSYFPGGMRLTQVNRLTVEGCTIGDRSVGNPKILETDFDLSFDPWSNPGTTLTGTVTFNGTTAVTGSGTRFTQETRVGNYIKLVIDGRGVLAQIVSINSDTSITLLDTYAGTSTTGAAHAGMASLAMTGNYVNGYNAVGSFSINANNGIIQGPAIIDISSNKFTGKSLTIVFPQFALTGTIHHSDLHVSGNQFSGSLGINCGLGVTTAYNTHVCISANSFRYGGIDLGNATGTGEWYTGTITGNSVHDGHIWVDYVGGNSGLGGGFSITGNHVTYRFDQPLRVFDSHGVVIDGNVIFQTGASSGNDKVVTIQCTRWRLTNNMIGKYWLSGTSSANLMDFQSSPDYGFIAGNHFYLIGTSPPAVSVSTAVGGNTKWLQDGAIGAAGTAFGGTFSSSAT